MRSFAWRSWGAATMLLVSAACGKDSKNGGLEPPENAEPSADFAVQCAARRCDFNDASSDSDGQIASRSWDFGDAGASTATNPSHTYATAGTYSVTLTVADDQGAAASRTKQVVATDPVVATLECADATAPGGYVACKLRLDQAASFKVVLTSRDCEAHGNKFEITEPAAAAAILTTDGCYEQIGKEIPLQGPFSAGTEIAAQVTAPLLRYTPGLRVQGAYPEWTLHFEDGGDATEEQLDYNDLVLTVTAVPAE